MRKTLSLVLAVVMMLVLLPAVKLNTAVAEDTPTYTKVTSAADLTEGSYLVVEGTNGFVFDGVSGDYHNFSEATITDGVISGDYASNEVVITPVTDGYTLKVVVDNATKYLRGTNGKNGIVFSDAEAVNTITLNEDGTAVIGYDDKTGATPTTQLVYNGTSGENGERFRYYKATTVASGASTYLLPTLFKKSTGTTPVDPPDDPPVDPPVEPETTEMELVPELHGMEQVVIYNAANSKVMTGENEYFEHASNPAKNKWQVVAADATLTDDILAVPEDAIVLTVDAEEDEDGVTRYAFVTEDEKYLYADGTDTMFVERTDDNAENTLFQLEPVEGGFYIKCDSATFNNKPQYIEYYGGHFTVYGMGSNAAIFTFQFYAKPDDTPEPPIVEPTGDTIILFTNDVHCGIRDGWGYAGVADLKKTLEAEGNEVILVDAGDHAQGGTIGSLTRGTYIIDIMNEVGYDLATLGNHEFDYGMDQLLNVLIPKANYPYVSANFVNLPDQTPVLDAYKIFEKNGKKIAFVGISTPESITKSTPAYFMNADRTEYIYGFCQDDTGIGVYTKVQAAIDAAKAEGADYVIAVGHMGIDEQSKPWTAPEVIANVTGVDAFIDGHSHSVINGDEVADKDGHTVLHGQTGTKLENVGKLTIAADGTLTMELLPASDKVKDDPEVDEYINGIEAEFEELLNTVVAHTDHLLTIKDPDTGKRAVRKTETNLGDLCADAYRHMFDSDIAFVNGGGVRADIPEGDITFQQIINVHPFGNIAVLAEVTGQQILDALEMGARVCPEENGGFLQVAGLTYEIHTYVEANVEIDDSKVWMGPKDASAEYRVKNVMIQNKTTGEYEPLDLAKKYTLASHNYMLEDMGDGMAMFQGSTILVESGIPDNQVLIDYIQSMPEVNSVHEVEGYLNPRGEGRIKIFNEAPSFPEEPEDWQPTFYGEALSSEEVSEYADGNVLYAYPIKLKGVTSAFRVVGMQLFVQVPDELKFVEARSELDGSLGINEQDGLISFAWTSAGGEYITVEDGMTVVTLYFELTEPVENGTELAIPFVETENGATSGFSYIYGTTVKEAGTCLTEDGSITFTLPEEIHFYGEDVLSKDISSVLDGEVLYRYDIKVKDLPEGGLMVNSLQIFLGYDKDAIAYRLADGIVDWTIAEKNGKLMAVWASEEDINLQNGTILSIYFIKKNAPTDVPVPIEFTANLLGNMSSASVVFGGEVIEIEATTEDGSITFTLLLGDANCDGKITSADAAAILRAVVHLSELSVEGAINADVDGDGEVTAEDAALILQYVVNLITAFPAEQP